MKKALLIIDVQNDYFPNGKCELYQSEIAVNAIKQLLKYFRENNHPVYYVQHISEENAAFLYLIRTVYAFIRRLSRWILKKS